MYVHCALLCFIIFSKKITT